MKLALVVPGGVDRSGVERVIPALLALIARLAKRHELHVYALNQEDRPGEWQLRGATVHNLGAGCGRARAIGALLSEHRRAPFQAIQSVWSGRGGLIAVAAARLAGVPGCVHVAGGELVAMPDIHYGGRLTWRGRLRETLVLRAASQVTAASAPLLAALSQLGIAARRVPLGVDLGAWPPRRPAPRSRGGPLRLVHVASLNRIKDQATLLRAIALLVGSGVEVHLDIVGEDTLHGELQRLTTQLQLDRQIRFHGFLAQAQLRPLVEDAALMVVSSRHEAGPVAVLEAAVAGVPTVGTAVGHIAEWAPAAAAAVPVGDSGALAAAIAALASDEPRRLELALAAQERALREDADHTAQCFESLYARPARG